MPAPAQIELPQFGRTDDALVVWATSQDVVEYPAAVVAMEARARAIADGAAEEMVWLLEHPSLYSAGVSAKPEDLLTPDRFPVFASGGAVNLPIMGPGSG